MEKRYLVDFDLDKMKKRYCDVVIVGTGIAGLYTALNIDSKYKVILMTKDSISENNSNLAQGGIAACVNADDDIETHIEDTMRAGSHYNDREAVRILVSEAAENIEKLINFGTKFDRDQSGKLMVTREGGHSERRVLHAKDQTGKEIVRALAKEVEKRENIEVIEEAFVIDVLTNRDTSFGMIIKDRRDIYNLYAKATVIAAGGIGQVYRNTTNSKSITGDGIAMAYRAGVEIIDMEFIQFHPTAFYSKEDKKRFLISEAVRGEGAVLRNSKGETFMEKYHELRDLAPRDIVAKAILTEMKKENKQNVYLDITNRDEEYIKNRFPYIYQECLNRGIDITNEYIPVCPVQHYIMGGIKTDYTGKTNIKGLYACGEAASVGVHGANRLASNSLLDGIVFGNRVAKDINKNISSENIVEIRLVYKRDRIDARISLKVLREKIQEIMNKYVFVFKKYEELNKAYALVIEVMEELYQINDDSKEYYECINITTIAYLTIDSALKRNKSIGSHIMIESMEVEGCD